MCETVVLEYNLKKNFFSFVELQVNTEQVM